MVNSSKTGLLEQIDWWSSSFCMSLHVPKSKPPDIPLALSPNTRAAALGALWSWRRTLKELWWNHGPKGTTPPKSRRLGSPHRLQKVPQMPLGPCGSSTCPGNIRTQLLVPNWGFHSNPEEILLKCKLASNSCLILAPVSFGHPAYKEHELDDETRNAPAWSPRRYGWCSRPNSVFSIGRYQHTDTLPCRVHVLWRHELQTLRPWAAHRTSILIQGQRICHS